MPTIGSPGSSFLLKPFRAEELLRSIRLELNAAAPAGGRGTLIPRPRAVGRPEAGQVIAYLRKHPSSRSEEISRELGTDTASLRPVLHRLRDEGKVKLVGKARATRYSAGT